ncbi:hypothetical protein [Streptomyces sp. NPDC086182]|uniref:hypothetical protein n=1 Tax=Streptomyces sp. NPDC086182 TaxID=3155058 RepID=UPI00343D1BC1
MNFDDLDEFDRLTSKVQRISALTALFADAEETLLATHPEGFEVEDIGRRAWALLPEGERERAFDELLYTYWEAVAADRETWARYEAGDAR